VHACNEKKVCVVRQCRERRAVNEIISFFHVRTGRTKLGYGGVGEIKERPNALARHME
jgi:hypothetical protein